jgi:threonylcarbamoyladenosine tRNA methylthiotransferase MtaB
VSAEHLAPRVALRTLGCKVNRAESESVAESLLGRGVELVAAAADADVVVINTCTVTGEADAKARKAVRRALGAGAGPIVVVTGCLAALDPDGLARLGRRVVVEADKSRVVARVAEVLGHDALGTAAGTRGPAPARTDSGFRTRVMVKVQDGCDHRCSYCIVPDARGAPRSVPAAQVVRRVSELACAGTREIVLTGVNIGRYADEGTDLGGLVERVGATGVPRIRISSIEPLDLTHDLLETLSCTPALLPHLHVPLQSGCDRTLQEMLRGYGTAVFADALRRARAALPGLAVTTDVIVGFPGETDDDFAESLAFVEACAFAKLHVFRYSKRPGTPAAGLPGHVDPRELTERAARMRALGDDLAARYACSRLGQTADLLVESIHGPSAHGTTEDYLRADTDAAGLSEGEVARVRLLSIDNGRMTAARIL